MALSDSPDSPPELEEQERDVGPAGAGEAAEDPARLPAPVLDLLTERLRSADCYLEFGAGWSTLHAVELGVPHVISVESDAQFLAGVTERVERISSATELHALHVDIGPTGPWGRPKGTSGFASWHRYPQAGFDRARRLGAMPDVVLIDGRFRVACFLAAALCVAPGTTILLDDYARRDHYHVVESFVPLERLIDRTALFIMPESVPVQELAFALARYSVISK